MSLPVACCSFVFRSAFLVVALPLLLVGGVLSELASQLIHQSVRQLEYAVGEEAAAWELQAQATRNAATATLDETEAKGLEADAARLEAESGEKEAQGAADEGKSGEAEGGNAAADGSQGAAAAEGTGVESESQVASLVEQAANAAAESGAAAGEATSAAGAGPMAAGAAEVAVDASAMTAAGTAGAAAGSEAAVVAAAATAAVAAPSAIKGAEADWAAAGDQVKAAEDESLATSEEAQADALVASVPVYEASSFEAHQAAAESLAAATVMLVTSQVAQVLALVCQAPIAMIVMARWGLASASGAMCLKDEGFTLAHWGSLGVSRGAMALGAGALLLAPWVEAVLIAAEMHPTSDVLDKLSRLPGLLSSATQGSSSASSTKASGEASQKTNASAVQSRRLALVNWTEMEKESKGIVAHVEEKAGNAVDKVEHEVHSEVVDLRKKWQVDKPDTATTTVTPRTTAEPPTQEDAVKGAVESILQRIAFWLLPMLQPLLLVSLLFLAAEMCIGLGRHGSLYPAVLDGLSHWLTWGSALVAIWLLSIFMAVQLKPLAEHLDGREVAVLAIVSIIAAFVAAAVHSLLLRDTRKKTPARSEYEQVHANDPQDADGTAPAPLSKKDTVTLTCAGAWAATAVGAAVLALIEVVEAPTFSSAVGGAFASFQKTQYLLPLAPLLWPLVQSHAHDVVQRLLIFGAGILLSLLVIGCLVAYAMKPRRETARHFRDESGERAATC